MNVSAAAEPPRGYYQSIYDVVSESTCTRESSEAVRIMPFDFGGPMEFKTPKSIEATIHPDLTSYSLQPFGGYVATLLNGKVWGESGAVLSPEGKLIFDLSQEYDAKQYRMLEADEHPIFHQWNKPVLQHYKGTVAVLTFCGSHNYFHWMFDVLPRLAMLHWSGIPYSSIIMNPNPYGPFVEQTWSMLGIEESMVIRTNPEAYIQADRLLVPSLMMNSHYPDSKQFGRPISELANQYNLIQSAIAGAERVFEVMDMPSEYDEEQNMDAPKLVGEVIFNDVSFGYTPDTMNLSGVSFTAKPGEKIALVGPTGAGKTTIVNLLTRFYDINGGTILIDGHDIRELDKNALRSQLGMVLQDAYVFSGTIRDNIRFGRLDATEQEIEQAARLANADGFIKRLPHGYETTLGAEGSNLSHGQRQLLTIARAILADPAILILDEATSSVDTRTEMHIQHAMKVLMKGRTSFVIAHRLSTIQDADRILVIQNGNIVEQGNHEQLLEQQGAYYELYNSQFKRAI